MPLFDYLCQDCGVVCEILVAAGDTDICCRTCGSSDLKKLLAAHSSMSGTASHRVPGPGDTPCCGASPQQAGCAGPGSCCGHRPH
jgi:putative FmdB family regulatory protein